MRYLFNPWCVLAKAFRTIVMKLPDNKDDCPPVMHSRYSKEAREMSEKYLHVYDENRHCKEVILPQRLMYIEIDLLKNFITVMENAEDEPRSCIELGDNYYVDSCSECKAETLWSCDPGGSGHSVCMECNTLR